MDELRKCATRGFAALLRPSIIVNNTIVYTQKKGSQNGSSLEAVFLSIENSSIIQSGTIFQNGSRQPFLAPLFSQCMIMELRESLEELSNLDMVEFFQSSLLCHRTNGLGRRGCDGITH